MKIDPTKFTANTDESDPCMVEPACSSNFPRARSICFGIFSTTGLKSLLIFVPSVAVKFESYQDILSSSWLNPIETFKGYLK